MSTEYIYIKALLHTSISIINHHSKNNFPGTKTYPQEVRRLLYKGIQGQKGRSKNSDLFTNSELLHLFDGKIQGKHKAFSRHVVKTINTFSADLQVLTDARQTKREFLPAFHSLFLITGTYSQSLATAWFKNYFGTFTSNGAYFYNPLA